MSLGSKTEVLKIVEVSLCKETVVFQRTEEVFQLAALSPKVVAVLLKRVAILP